MKHFTEVTETKLVKKYGIPTCDKCGEKICSKSYDAYDEDWFSARFGSSFPECSLGHEFNMDLCQDCTRELIDLLEDNGFHIRKEEWGF